MKKSLARIFLLLVVFDPGGIARAQDIIMDYVDTSVEPDWAQMRIHLTMPVNYARHFPKEHGQLLQIFFTINGMDAYNLSLREEVRNVPATPVLPGATITYDPPISLNLQRDMSTLSVRFDRAVNYDVRPGDDRRSIVIYLPVVPVETKPTDATKDKPVK